MSKFHDVLAELKDMGALGTPEDTRKRTVEEVTVESGAPSVPLRDARGERTAELLEALSEQLQTVSAAAESAAAIVAKLAAVWASDGGTTAEDEDEDEEDAEEPKASRKEAAVVAPVPKEPVKPENYEKLMESVRRRVRGDDLSPAQLAAAFGEAPQEEDDGVPDAVPLGNLNFTPTWPKKE